MDGRCPSWALRWRLVLRQNPTTVVAILLGVVVLLVYSQRRWTYFAVMPPGAGEGFTARSFRNTHPDVCKAQSGVSTTYAATEASLSSHKQPAWFKAARFGIFIHWGLYSVPGWAETRHSFEEFNKGVSPEEHFKHNPYAEWYLNTARLKDSGAQQHHKLTYNDEDPNTTHPSRWYYSRFAKTFDRGLSLWEPAKWAKIFARSGAGYVVLTTKHHDGYCLWPTEVEHPQWKAWAGKEGAPRHPSKRDIVGELSKAVRSEGLQMGLYYSGGLDWSFKWAIDTCFDDATGKALCHPGIPNDNQYATYAGAQLEELMDKYRPSILWDDINWPGPGKLASFGRLSLPTLFAKYFNKICPAGLVNDRWKLLTSSRPWKWTGDIGTPEYSQLDLVQSKVFETCRGIGKSFGYNRVEEESVGCKAYMSVADTVLLLVQTVAKNGNLLLDVGPDENGRIPPCQVAVLDGIGKWLKTFGTAVMGTVPYAIAGSKIPASDPVRYMQSVDHSVVYVIVLGATVKRAKQDKEAIRIFQKARVPALHIQHRNRAGLMLPGGESLQVRVQQNENDLSVFVPWSAVPGGGNQAWVLRFFLSRSSKTVVDCRHDHSCLTFK